MNKSLASKPHWIKRGVLIASFGVGVYSIAYFWTSHGEGFDYAESWVRSSQAVTSSIGPVSSVYLSPIHEFRYKFAGDDATFLGTLVATGSTSQISVKVVASKHDGTWTLQKAEGNGNVLN